MTMPEKLHDKIAHVIGIILLITSIITILVLWIHSQKIQPPQRCIQCGAKISILYSDGRLCENCTKNAEAAKEAQERLNFLQYQKP